MSKEQLDQALAPLIDFIQGLDPASPDAAAKVSARFPSDSPALAEIAELFQAGVDEGWLCDRKGSETVSYSRVRKSDGDGLSIDAVRMTGPGPGHLHPNGEFDLCFAASGDPSFDDKGVGWIVYPPGSWHIPTVTGGVMNILYFLPGGAIEFGPRPS